MRNLILPAVLIFILILGVVLGIAIFQIRQGPKEKTINLPTPTVSLTPTPSPIVPTATSTATPTASPRIVGVSAYENRGCKFAINYPGVWQLVESVGGARIENPTTGEEIKIACQPDIPRIPLPPEKIENINLDGVAAKLYHDASAKDGSPLDVVIGDVPGSGNDFYLAGFGAIFNDILTSFHWII